MFLTVVNCFWEEKERFWSLINSGRFLKTGRCWIGYWVITENAPFNTHIIYDDTSEIKGIYRVNSFTLPYSGQSRLFVFELNSHNHPLTRALMGFLSLPLKSIAEQAVADHKLPVTELPTRLRRLPDLLANVEEGLIQTGRSTVLKVARDVFAVITDRAIESLAVITDQAIRSYNETGGCLEKEWPNGVGGYLMLADLTRRVTLDSDDSSDDSDSTSWMKYFMEEDRWGSSDSLF